MNPQEVLVVVALPALIGIILTATVWLMPLTRQGRPWISALSLLVGFVLSMYFISGFPQSPVEAWKYVALAMAIQVAVLLPCVIKPNSLGLFALLAIGVAITPSLLLNIPDANTLPWRIVLFAFIVVTSLVLTKPARHTGFSVPFALWFPATGLSFLLIVSGFAMAALIMGAIAAMLGGFTVFGLIKRSYMLGYAGMSLMVAIIAMMTLVGYGYDYDSFSRWSWIIIAIAPLGLLADNLRPATKPFQATVARIAAVALLTILAVAIAMTTGGSTELEEDYGDLDLYTLTNDAGIQPVVPVRSYYPRS